jgi:hypothetical protein
MSTQKRTRRSVTGGGVNNQGSNPASAESGAATSETAPNPSGALQEFEHWAEHVRQDFLAVLEIEMPDDVRGGIYITRQSLTRLIESGRDLAKARAGAGSALASQEGVQSEARSVPHAEAVHRPPLLLGDDPDDLQGMRLHIDSCYRHYLTRQHADGFSSMLNLWECIQHHPGLRAESDALRAMFDGHCAIEKAFDLKRTYVETWLSFRFAQVTTGEDLLNWLRGVSSLLKDNPATAELLRSIEAMMSARSTMWRMSQWLDSI